ncbi:hypothetical protein NQ176_g3435 [Zarea fungicola]|uniref:Uncharacterized protein n=1 Tax=Zarea fungicola TaxID=93591 RepID=A0ACC1NII2_9HYPO|nr:hypothetical protein NQ176_g3435 [Lecanicillium fungicola]
MKASFITLLSLSLAIAAPLSANENAAAITSATVDAEFRDNPRFGWLGKRDTKPNTDAVFRDNPRFGWLGKRDTKPNTDAVFRDNPRFGWLGKH